MLREVHALVLAAVLLGACGGADVVEDPAPFDDSPPPPVMTLEAFAGSYRIDGQAITDGCAEGVYLAARNIVVDPIARSLQADVVERTYAARVDGETLVAEGRFPSPDGCPDSTLYETWVLAREGDALTGTLSSTWLLRPDCMHPCTIEFAISARR